MSNSTEMKRVKKSIISAVLVLLLLCFICMISISYVYHKTEENSYEQLHLQTKLVKDNIDLQFFSDRENLATIASLASHHYEDDLGFRMIVDSFQPIGLICRIEILNEENKVITQSGEINPPDGYTFEEEAKKGEYVSGEVAGFERPDVSVIRSSVPIVSGGKTVGILYGVIDVDFLNEKYRATVDGHDSQLYVYETENGNTLINASVKERKNLFSLSDRVYKEGYSFEKLDLDIKNNTSGFTAFKSKYIDDTVYMHYAPLEIANWTICYALSEDNVFKVAHSITNIMLLMFVSILIIAITYTICMFLSEREQTKLQLTAAKTRKLLLTYNQNSSRIEETLEIIAKFAVSRSSFFMDINGLDKNYLMPSVLHTKLNEEERAFFRDSLIKYVARNRTDDKTSTYTEKIVIDEKLNAEYPELCEMLRKHNVKSVVCSVVADGENISVIGVTNPKIKKGIREFLKEIAVCFAIAVYNKNHLNKTEIIATTDALTGLSNRSAYIKDAEKIQITKPRNTACIFVDVNELHYINNQYGHIEGDRMLIYIANVLREEFTEGTVYRIGGDEFLIFSFGVDEESVKYKMFSAVKKIEEKNYHVAMGFEMWNGKKSIEELVNSTEKKMYDEKAKYYREREKRLADPKYIQKVDVFETGFTEVDEALSAIGTKYQGICTVSLKTGKSTPVLSDHNSLEIFGDSVSFKEGISKYVHELVKPEFQRAVTHVLNLNSLYEQAKVGKESKVSFEKINGEKITLTIYPIADSENLDTVWLFEKEK